MINGTVITAHERTSENNRKNRIVEACYIFRYKSPSINQCTKVVIVPLSQIKEVWVNSTAPVPSSLTMMATTPAPLSKTLF